MAATARTALVLQGGGALGAYELGAARRLYRDGDFAPDLIAGVSIGAITAVLLGRPRQGLLPLEALEAFWSEVTVSGWFLPPPLRRTLAGLVNREALADPEATPALLVTATDVAAGQIEVFYSRDGRFSLEHVLASGSLPPSFPMTRIEGVAYWDGGLFDNTPLGAVLDKMDGASALTAYVVNLFPNVAPIPRTMAQVIERVQNLQFANKTAEDLKLLHRFDEIAALIEALGGHSVADDPAVAAALAVVRARGYVRVPKIVPITRPQQLRGFDGSDFSPEAIKARADEGYARADEALASASMPQSP